MGPYDGLYPAGKRIEVLGNDEDRYPSAHLPSSVNATVSFRVGYDLHDASPSRCNPGWRAAATPPRAAM